MGDISNNKTLKHDKSRLKCVTVAAHAYMEHLRVGPCHGETKFLKVLTSLAARRSLEVPQNFGILKNEVL